MKELIVQATMTPGEIKSNLDDLAVALTNQMEAYKDLEVTEDNIPERKADLATLRKESKAIDDRRKEIKKEWDKPLKEFEAKVKGVIDIIDTQIQRIDGDIKEFDRKRIEEKQAHIKELYDKEIGEYAEFLPLSIIKSSKWDNKTCSDNEIISEMQEMTMRVKNDLAAIDGLQSEIKDKLLSVYKASGNNLSAAIQRNTEYLEAKRAAEERLKAEAEAKQKAEEAKKAEEQKPEPIPAPVACQPAEPVNVWDEPILTIRVKGADSIEALKMFLEASEIEYEEVKA